ncbi:UNVERIFIED_CONTAM: hypothetical protein FKN15_075201 [Acipenser sinensis]
MPYSIKANLRSSVSSETYQERLARLEADKESLVLQVSVLTDQVEAQGEKIRDLESSLDEHHHKQQTTQEMLQQELLSRTYLETQKLDLIDEVSHLKLKLVGMEKEQNDCDEKQHKAESVVNLISELQEQMCRFQQEISARIQEKKEQESNPADTKAKDPPQNRTGTSLASPSRDEESCHCRGENWGNIWDYGYLPPPPNRGKTLKIDDATLSSYDLSPQSSGVDSGQQSPVSPENRKNPKGIKKFWGKIRRTQSGSLQAGDSGTSQFQRGGLRATAGPRLARTKETGNTKSDWNAPFSQWKMEQVCSWLEDFGLSQYVNLARQWVKTGHTLLTASPQDLEKEMGIKHPLHRKKLQLALKAFGMKQVEKSADLDHIWVTRWLDDIGLPQYKDQFNEGRVDGMMLQYLTVILEPRFNSDTLAMLLNIPPQKTLLRRHLTTNFKMLIGSEAQQEKREFMESSSYAPLTTTAKVRPKKLGFSNFGHLRKKKFDDSTDYVYPMDTAQSATNGAQKGYGGHRRLSPVFGRDLHRLEQVGQS